MQLQIFNTDAEFGIFCVWCPNWIISIVVHKDIRFLFEKIGAAKKFFKLVILPELLGSCFTRSRMSLSKLRASDICVKYNFYGFKLFVDEKVANKLK